MVTADHGVAFSAGQPIRGLAEGNAHEVMWVPFLLKEPGQQRGVIDERPVSTVDVVPTVLDLIGIDPGWPLDGRSAFDRPTTADPDVRLFADWSLNRLRPTDGIFVEVDGTAGYRELLASTPPPSDDPVGLRPYRIGEYGALVGRELDDLVLGPNRDLAYTIDDPARYAAVDPDTDRLPVHLTGEVDTADPPPIAIAVDGTVAAWAAPTPDGSRSTFHGVLLPSSIGPGTNDIMVLEIVGPPGDAVLHPLVDP